jgi:uncharacterized protein (TIGR03067 family)
MVVFSLVAGLSTAGDKPAQKDLDAMQGTWQVAELTEMGEKLPAKELAPIEVVILATKMTINDDGKFREEITLKLDAAMKPKAVDFVYTKGPNTGKTERGIYSIDGDTLKFCMSEKKEGERPADFISTKDNHCSLAVLKRAKK